MAGRPPKPDSERRDYTLRIRLNPSERAAIDKIAQAAEMDTSTWAREILLSQTAPGKGTKSQRG